MYFLLIITFVFSLCSSSLAWVLYQMIQPGQLLEKWQDVLNWVYSRSRLLEMFLGGCIKCFNNFIAHITFSVYLLWQYNVWWMGWWNIAIYFGFITFSIVVGMLVSKALTEKDESGMELRIQEIENKLEQINPTIR